MSEARWIQEALELGRRMGFPVRAHEPMSRHTTFRVGGPADILADPCEPRHVQALRSFADQTNTPFTLLGAGSNIVVRDGGIRGIVCRLGKYMARITVNRRDCTVTAQAGARMKSVCTAASDAALTGLEFAVGIPGTVGGAVYMNAGAHGGCMGDIIVEVLTLCPKSDLVTLRPEELDLGYRKTSLQRNGHIVLEARFGLAIGDEAEIRARQQDILERRSASQPLDLPSAGSVFKRPPGDYAGRLIETCGLKGKARVGGAMVSEKHAGFIVNMGDATATDVIALIQHVRTVVQDETGVLLEPEVAIIGEDLPAATAPRS